MISGATFVPTQQLTAISTMSQPMLGNAVFPPLGSTLASAMQPPIAKFGAGFLGAVLPTFQTPQVQSPFTNETIATPGLPSAPGENEFAASYAPQIYAVYLNGFIANASIASTSLATDLFHVDVAQPPISGDPQAPVPGLPPIQPVPGAEGTQQVVAAVGRLAGSGAILSSAPPARASAPAKKAA
jgi:hypothetical protein